VTESCAAERGLCAPRFARCPSATPPSGRPAPWAADTETARCAQPVTIATMTGQFHTFPCRLETHLAVKHLQLYGGPWLACSTTRVSTRENPPDQDGPCRQRGVQCTCEKPEDTRDGHPAHGRCIWVCGVLHGGEDVAHLQSAACAVHQMAGLAESTFAYRQYRAPAKKVSNMRVSLKLKGLMFGRSPIRASAGCVTTDSQK
jgi:hypothetical protein